MAYIPEGAPCAGRIRTVTFGTGEGAITLGGQNAMPLYGFDAPFANPPRAGIAVTDLPPENLPELTRFYEGCETMAQRAVRARERSGADFLCLCFPGADPGGANRSVEACTADAVAAAAAVDVPLAVVGCGNLQKDELLLTAIAEALKGRNLLLFAARSENYQRIAALARDFGHKIVAQTADDVNLAKQLNIMLKGVGVSYDSIVMNVGTAAVGYGYDYVASTYDRIRLAALEQSDEDLQMPIAAPIYADVWSVKEAVAEEADEPQWGSREERGICMETATAAADLTAGADAVILSHPASVQTVRRFIRELTEGGAD